MDYAIREHLGVSHPAGWQPSVPHPDPLLSWRWECAWSDAFDQLVRDSSGQVPRYGGIDETPCPTVLGIAAVQVWRNVGRPVGGMGGYGPVPHRELVAVARAHCLDQRWGAVDELIDYLRTIELTDLEWSADYRAEQDAANG